MSAELNAATAALADGEVVVAAELLPLLEEADRRGARAAVLLRAGGRDDARVGLLAGPLLEAGLDAVFAAYRRPPLDGVLNTALLYPLLRALYGRRIVQPCGGEVALSAGLVRALLASPERPRAPRAGTEAWLAAATLGGRWRVGQAWLGPWKGEPARGDDPSHVLATVLGPVFEEMARTAARWQRIEDSGPVATFGDRGHSAEAHAPDTAALAAAFRLGVRELSSLWSEVLPPATMLALTRAAASDPPRLDDSTWARAVYDFALAFSLRTMERHQLLRSMTPIYLGWVAGYADDVRDLESPAVDARVETICDAFEREKPYAIARWRWPDGFAP